MKRGSAAIALVTAAVLWGSTGCERSRALSEADKAAIREVGATYARLMNARDFKGVASLYAEDAMLLPPNHAAVEGRVAIQAFLEVDGPVSDFQVQLLEADGRQDLAYAREMASFTLHLAGAPPTRGRSKVLSIWRKNADGAWKVLRDTWNPEPGPGQEKH